IVAVLAHEIGHYKKKHIVKGLLMSLAQTAVMVWLLSLALNVPDLSLALGAKESSFYLGIIAFGLLFSPVEFFTGIVTNMISRKYEYQADAFAKNHQFGTELINALIKLSRNNLSNLTPHPAYVFFHYSHPTLLQRKTTIEKEEKGKILSGDRANG
ncbi:MAG: M48 family metalloprotease, partial [Chlorobi bacterium]|nr:M48 family metalloprotease [Chlorobiota bacterium]